MNNKITFPRLASMLADNSGRTKRFSEDFLREFFSLISESLENGETVKVKGLGTFRLSRVEPRKSVDVTTGEPMEISGHTKVVFVPAKEMAEAVNAPFEAFAAVEITDSVDTAILDDETSIEQSVAISSELVEEITNSERAPILDENVMDKDVKVEEIEIVPQKTDTDIEYHKPESEEAEINDSIEVSDDLEPAEEEVEVFDRHHWLKGFLTGIGAATALIAVAIGCWIYFARPDIFPNIGKSATTSAMIEDAEIILKDTVADTDTAVAVIETKSANGLNTASSVIAKQEKQEVPTAPSDEAVYDTIGKTRYLTTMAKAHYGNYNLWPYIYEENKAFLRHPDRIRPGTPVVVPKLSKYGVDPKNPKDIEAAKKLGVEIYARYKKE